MSSNSEHCTSSITASEEIPRYWKSCCSGRVRDLAKRFEQPTTTHLKNSFSRASRKRLYQNSDKREKSV
uniref:HTH psq-type domain-containing protein n=1 Tax=Syphacia muris TaxID=451379 RepID=A0A0N5AEN3_9BILA